MCALELSCFLEMVGSIYSPNHTIHHRDANTHILLHLDMIRLSAWYDHTYPHLVLVSQHHAPSGYQAVLKSYIWYAQEFRATVLMYTKPLPGIRAVLEPSNCYSQTFRETVLLYIYIWPPPPKILIENKERINQKPMVLWDYEINCYGKAFIYFIILNFFFKKPKLVVHWF